MTTALVAASMAAVAGLLGIMIGRFWDSRSELVRWRRDQQTTSYQRFAERYQVAQEAHRILALADPSDEQALELARPTGGWHGALAGVWLHGSADVVAAATAVDRAQDELFHNAKQRQLSVEEWNNARIPTRRAFESFIEAVRAELNLPSVPVKFFPEPPDQQNENPAAG